MALAERSKAMFEKAFRVIVANHPEIHDAPLETWLDEMLTDPRSNSPKLRDYSNDLRENREEVLKIMAAISGYR
jgi:hypothetical protein